MIDHPAVKSCEQTCGACPEQYEGTLQDGREFYFRYRGGCAQLGVGSTQDEAVWATIRGRVGAFAEVEIGNPFQGIFDDHETRDRVFADLYAEIVPAVAS